MRREAGFFGGFGDVVLDLFDADRDGRERSQVLEDVEPTFDSFDLTADAGDLALDLEDVFERACALVQVFVQAGFLGLEVADPCFEIDELGGDFLAVAPQASDLAKSLAAFKEGVVVLRWDAQGPVASAWLALAAVDIGVGDEPAVFVGKVSDVLRDAGKLINDQLNIGVEDDLVLLSGGRVAGIGAPSAFAVVALDTVIW